MQVAGGKIIRQSAISALVIASYQFTNIPVISLELRFKSLFFVFCSEVRPELKVRSYLIQNDEDV